jgi:NAD(P)-dependent dehydrogenase (short-subunit alcohol dehydrogenase family)
VKSTSEVLKGVDLSGRVALVTGASAGLGAETARALAAHGAEVIGAVRDIDKARAKLGDANVELMALDLASLTSVREFAAAFTATHPALHLLINNAGVMATPFEHTADGFELQFGTNHLGHFLLTTLVMPTLVASAPARIVNLSSAGHFASDVVFDDLNYERREYDKWTAYGQSKTANILFTIELERLFAAEGVHAYAVHPGLVATELGRHMQADDMKTLQCRAESQGRTLPPMQHADTGASTTVWAATAPELADTGGVYLVDCEISDEHAAYAFDAANAQRLWNVSYELTRS